MYAFLFQDHIVDSTYVAYSELVPLPKTSARIACRSSKHVGASLVWAVTCVGLKTMIVNNPETITRVFDQISDVHRERWSAITVPLTRRWVLRCQSLPDPLHLWYVRYMVCTLSWFIDIWRWATERSFESRLISLFCYYDGRKTFSAIYTLKIQVNSCHRQQSVKNVHANQKVVAQCWIPWRWCRKKCVCALSLKFLQILESSTLTADTKVEV